MKSGERFNAGFRGSDLESITVKPTGDPERRVVKEEVKQIEREGVTQDHALDGAGIGAAVGAAVGLLIGRAAEEDKEALMLGGAMAWAGIVFGIGYAVDSSLGQPVLLYQALE